MLFLYSTTFDCRLHVLLHSLQHAAAVLLFLQLLCHHSCLEKRSDRIQGQTLLKTNETAAVQL